MLDPGLITAGASLFTDNGGFDMFGSGGSESSAATSSGWYSSGSFNVLSGSASIPLIIIIAILAYIFLAKK